MDLWSCCRLCTDIYEIQQDHRFIDASCRLLQPQGLAILTVLTVLTVVLVHRYEIHIIAKDRFVETERHRLLTVDEVPACDGGVCSLRQAGLVFGVGVWGSGSRRWARDIIMMYSCECVNVLLRRSVASIACRQLRRARPRKTPRLTPCTRMPTR